LQREGGDCRVKSILFYRARLGEGAEYRALFRRADGRLELIGLEMGEIR
jgi:hypothetical protein